MGQDRHSLGHISDIKSLSTKGNGYHSDDIVLEKGVFQAVFEKDIRRVFIYKKAERLARALHLIAPAFATSTTLRERADTVAVALVDAALRAPREARGALARELLALSSVLAIARTGGLLSAMNADLITHEIQLLLQEIADYEEPRLTLEEAPTLSGIAKKVSTRETLPLPAPRASSSAKQANVPRAVAPVHKGGVLKDRREAILSVIKDKKKASIKDISLTIRGVSEKTIQRELQALIAEGEVSREGERRWSTYSLA